MTEFVNVSTQGELDAAVAAGNIPICKSGFFMAFGSATVEAFGSATVRAFDSATVEAFDSATVRAFDSATVEAFDSATVRASGSATVRAFDSATVEAFDSATVRASDSATVRASGSATVRAFDSATVRAFDSATVRASGSATVRAFDSATVEAFDSATVRASGSATVRASGSATVEAFDSATVRASPFVAIHRHSQHATVNGGVLIQVPECKTADEWAAYFGLSVSADEHVVLFKAVNDSLVSGHGAVYTPGEATVAPDFVSHTGCGNGLHFSPRPRLALRYAHGATRFVACRVRLADAVVIDSYGGPSDKVKAPSCDVLYECDADGVEIVAVAAGAAAPGSPS